MNWVRHILIFLLRCYQRLLSPLLRAIFGPAGACRFSPSCSHYAVEALQVHGVVKGTLLAAARLCRCHPWGGCGDDPVPPRQIKALREADVCGCKCRTAGATGGSN